MGGGLHLKDWSGDITHNSIVNNSSHPEGVAAAYITFSRSDTGSSFSNNCITDNIAPFGTALKIYVDNFSQ